MFVSLVHVNVDAQVVLIPSENSIRGMPKCSVYVRAIMSIMLVVLISLNYAYAASEMLDDFLGLATVLTSTELGRTICNDYSTVVNKNSV